MGKKTYLREEEWKEIKDMLNQLSEGVEVKVSLGFRKNIKLRSQKDIATYFNRSNQTIRQIKRSFSYNEYQHMYQPRLVKWDIDDYWDKQPVKYPEDTYYDLIMKQLEEINKKIEKLEYFVLK